MTIHIGIIGTGSFARLHASIVNEMEDVVIRGVCGRSLEKAKQIAKDYPQAKAYNELTKMLDNEQIDAAYICVPPFAHGEIEELLVERGIPFFVEKPLSTNIEIPTTILNKIKEKQLLTSVGYHFRYLHGTRKAKELLQDCTIGMAIGYWMGTMPEVSWWRKNETSGGQFVEQTTHIVDLVRYVLGEVEEVRADFAKRLQPAKAEINVSDVGTVTLKMSSGAIVTIHNTCILPIDYQNGLDVYTDRGVLRLNQQGLQEVNQDEIRDYSNDPSVSPYEKESQAFIHAVRTSDSSQILSTYEDAWKTQQIAIAANQSAELGHSIKLAK